MTTPNELPTQAEVHYAGQVYTIPIQCVEEIEDVITGIDVLDGGFLYEVGGGDEQRLKFWITPGTPIVLVYPPSYKPDYDRPDYVIEQLQYKARYRLKIARDGSEDDAAIAELED